MSAPQSTEAPTGTFRPPMDSETGRNLLLGFLALQNNFIDREELLAAFNTWVVDKSKSFGAILACQRSISPARLALLDGLVDEHFKQHGGDPEASLAAVNLADRAHSFFLTINDSDVRECLRRATAARIDTGDESDATTPPAGVGNRTSAGTRFRILKELKEGGMGKVSIASDQELNRQVALKEIGPLYSHDRLSRLRFVVEAEITGALEHPSIVPIYGLGHYDDGRPFYAMRLMRDETLRDAIAEFHAGNALRRDRSEHSIAFRELLGRFLDICDAIDYAHHRGILHRDLKPGNILLGRFGETVVVDWGLAKLIDRVADPGGQMEPTLTPASASHEWHTWSGSAHGTIGYMPPEQAAGQHDQLGPRSDVYALGAILYTLMTGKPSIKLVSRDTPAETHRDVVQAIEDIVAGKFPRPRAVKPKLPAALEAVCLKAMAKAPADRYPSVRALAEEVKHWLADEPVSAYPESTVQRLARWTRRHRAWAQAALAAMVVVTGVSSVAAVLVGRAYRNENQARSAEHVAKLQAEHNFKEARGAVYQLVDLAGQQLAHVNGTENFRKELAEQALASSRGFLRSQPRDPTVRFDTARILRVTANIGRMIGQFDEPRPLYQEAAALLKELADESPKDLAIREEEVWNTIDTGELYGVNGLPAKSRSYAQAALDLLDAPEEGFPESPSKSRMRAITLLNLANAQNESGRYEEARGSGRRTIELLSKLGGDGVDDPMNTLLLVMARDNMGVTERELGHDADSKRVFDLAISRVGALAAKYNSPDIKRARASVLSHLGELLASDPERQGEAMTAFESARQVLVPLARAYPHIPHFIRDLAVAYNGLGGTRLALGLAEVAKNRQKASELFEGAKGDCQRAEKLFVDLLKSRKVFDYYSYLGQTQANLARIDSAQGSLDAARTMFDRAIAAHTNAIASNPESLIDRKLLKKVMEERANLK